MGEFDAFLGAGTEKKKPAREFEAFLSAPSSSAKGGPFPWETEAPGESRPFSRATQEYDANVEALADTPRPPTSITGNLKQIGQNIAGGARAVADVATRPKMLAALAAGPAAPIVQMAIMSPEERREMERGLSDTITLGLAEKAARKVDQEAFSQETAAADAEAAPGLRTGAGLVGTALPNPVSFVAGKVGAAVPGRGLVPGAVRGVAQYEATAPVAAAIQAEPGQRLDAAGRAATDPAGLIVSGGVGGVGGAIGRAPERVRERGTEALARGEAGGTATKGVRDKAMARAGEGGEDLYAEIGNDIRLEAGQSVLAKSNPGVVAKMYTRRLDGLTERTEPFYQAIDDAPDPRFANPAKAPRNGGIDIGRVEKRLEESMERARQGGHAVMVETYDKALARLRAQHGTDGVILPGEKLPARSMRNYANTLGEALLPESLDPKTRTLAQQAKRAVYRDVVGAIEDEGTRVGLDMTELKALNRKISTFVSARDALADRANRAAQGHTTLGNLGLSTALIGGGGAAGGLEGAAIGAALDAGRRIAMPAARGLDFAVAKLVQASRLGAQPAQLASMALQMGISQEVADRIRRDGLGVLPIDKLLHGPGAGMIEPGNIDLKNRPRVKNEDGSISTVRSLGVNIDGQEVLIPTVSEDGRIMSDDEAVEQYRRTGRHLGKFRTPAASTAYAERLHEDQARLIGP